MRSCAASRPHVADIWPVQPGCLPCPRPARCTQLLLSAHTRTAPPHIVTQVRSTERRAAALPAVAVSCPPVQPCPAVLLLSWQPFEPGLPAPAPATAVGPCLRGWPHTQPAHPERHRCVNSSGRRFASSGSFGLDGNHHQHPIVTCATYCCRALFMQLSSPALQLCSSTHPTNHTPSDSHILAPTHLQLPHPGLQLSVPPLSCRCLS